MRKQSILLLFFILLLLSGCDKSKPQDVAALYYKDEEITQNGQLSLPVYSSLEVFENDFTAFLNDTTTPLQMTIDTSSIDNSLLGEYEVTITFSETSLSNQTISITVQVIDTVVPEITYDNIPLDQGSTIVDLLKQFHVTDNYDSDLLITSTNISDSSVNFDVAGTYTITINVQDSSSNTYENSFSVTILEKEFTRPSKDEDIDDGKIYYILESNIPGYYDYHIAAKAIQGVVNRNQPNLMIIDQNNPYYTYTDMIWKDYIEDQGYELIELTSFLEILVTFEHYFSDIIAINDEYKSYNNWVSSDADFGAMLTAVTTYMPVPEGLVNQAEDYLDIEMIDSFILNDVLLSGIISDNFAQYNISTAQEGYGFLFDNFKELFVTTGFMGLTSEAMDYAVQREMMFFDLKPTYNNYDKELYTRICEYFNENSVFFRVYGWVDQEGSALDFIGRYGGMINPVGTQNMSLYHIIPVDYDFTQKSEFISTYNTNMKYVTFLASEGDTFKAPSTFQQGSWLDDYRGTVPINWGLIGVTVEEFPIIAKYMYETMTANDYFFSGGSSSIGYVDIDTQMPNDAIQAIVAYNQYILGLSDQEYVDTYNDLFMFGDAYDPTVTGDYLIASGYKGAYGINPWAPTGPTYLSDMLFYNRRNVFYPRRGSSTYVSLSNLTIQNSENYIQNYDSDYWYIQTDLVRTTSNDVSIDFFTQSNNDGYTLSIQNGTIELYKTVAGTKIILDTVSKSMIGSKELIISVDKSSSMLDETVISIYIDQDRVFHLTDASFSSGGFALYAEGSVINTFTNLKGQHKSQSEEIYDKILNDSNQFIVGYYGVVFDHDFTLSQYHTEPGPGEVISLSPTDFYRIQLLLNENHPGEYQIVNMDEFYTYLELSESE